ncbi:hypothetical protein H4R99_002193 [Coemansia sp. RSA 1722]|nr:hypothetical protein IWW45_005003 [Coemansia sp. RSA 485]KAJ2603851.1 hypothetical protein H4R99_002193 [Coemansia sp. RSA 1722]
MTSTKRARLDDGVNGDSGQLARVELKLRKEEAIEMPSEIGAISAIAAFHQAKSRFEDTRSSADDSVIQGVQTQIVVATDAGYVALVHEDGTRTVLDSSGNPAIQRLLAMAPSDASAFRPGLIPDVVAGDSDGRVTVFTMGRMISRSTVSAPVSALALDNNPNTPRSFIVGDMSGTITESHVQGILWRTQLSTAASDTPGATGTGITSVCSVRFADDHGIPTSYVLAASEGNHVQLLARGHPVLTVPISARCNCMCSGRFIGRNGLSDDAQNKETQALLGDDSGRLYVLDNFKIEPYAHLDYPVTSVVAIPLRALVGRDGPDVVVCGTRSNMIYMLHAKQILGAFAADFWPAAIDVIVPSSPEMHSVIAIAENKAVGIQNPCVLHKVAMIFKDIESNAD